MKIVIFALKSLFYYRLMKNRFTLNSLSLLLETDSIVEKQGWEVRWAKPIGASKVLERERYIREAVAHSNVQKIEIPRSKQGKKRSIKALSKTHEDDNVYLAQMKVLQNFVKERFDAICIFDCVQISDASEYISKV